MPMKSESPDEARERLKALSEAEKRGAEAVTEGQIQPIRDETVTADDAVTFTGPRPFEGTTVGSAEVKPAAENTSDKRKASKR